MKFLGFIFVLALFITHSFSLSAGEKEEELENALMKAIEEEEKETEIQQGKHEVDEEEENEDLDEVDLLDEIYQQKHDPFWWSSKSRQQKTSHHTTSINGSHPRKPATRRWARIKQKAKSFLHGAHKVITKAQQYAPHVLKAVKYGAMLLGKKKRELRTLEMKQRHLKREIEELEDEMMRKKK